VSAVSHLLLSARAIQQDVSPCYDSGVTHNCMDRRYEWARAKEAVEEDKRRALAALEAKHHEEARVQACSHARLLTERVRAMRTDSRDAQCDSTQ
jgi:rhamnogalacturonyl hydrolase YesR